MFANRIAAFLWGFALVYLFLLILFTFLLVRDGPPEGYNVAAFSMVMAFFWLAGAGLICYATGKPCYFVTVDRSEMVRFTMLYPHRRQSTEFAASDLAPPYVVNSQDDEGNPYFVARLKLPDGQFFRLAEGHSQSNCEEACVRFTDALQSVGT